MSTGQYSRMAIYYLLYYTTVATFVPYFNLYLSAKGFSNSQVGVVLAVIPLIGLIVKPLWGMLSDYFEWHRPAIALSLLMAPIILATFVYIRSYLVAVVAAAVFAIFQQSVIPIGDSLTMQNAGSKNYGKIRMFGSLGYAVVVAIASPIYNQYGIRWMILLYALASGTALIGVWLYPSAQIPVQTISKTGDRERQRRNMSMSDGLLRLLKNKSFITVIPFTFIASIGLFMNGNFFSLYYTDLHRPIGLLGFIYALGAICELPVFFWSGHLIERFGCGKVLFVGYLVFAARWLVLSFDPPTWVIVLQQATHGISLSLTFAAGIVFAARVSVKENQATAQTVFSAVNTAIAAIIGSLVGGIALEHLGTHGLYECALALGIVGCAGILWLERSGAFTTKLCGSDDESQTQMR